MSRYSPPGLLAGRHQLAGFRCRSEELTAWQVDVAKQAHGTPTAGLPQSYSGPAFGEPNPSQRQHPPDVVGQLPQASSNRAVAATA